MEYLGEFMALGIDSIILGICIKQCYHWKHAIKSIKGAEYHEIGPSLYSSINANGDDKVAYVVVRGSVTPLGTPLVSLEDRSIKGVVQKLSVKEHVVARTSAGFWSDQENTVHQICNTAPFALRNGIYKVEVVDALSADILDTDVIKDRFTPSEPSLKQYLWAFFTGVRQRGVRSTEEMLRVDTIVTGIGQLVTDPDRSRSLILQPPVDGRPLYLTTMSVGSLLRKLEERRTTYRWLTVLFGGIGILIGGIIVMRYLRDREEGRSAEERRRELENSRRGRRRQVRDYQELREEQLCVVCRDNPREIILLPCGHVCVCEDCAASIANDCPVCRGRILQKSAAYIS